MARMSPPQRGCRLLDSRPESTRSLENSLAGPWHASPTFMRSNHTPNRVVARMQALKFGQGFPWGFTVGTKDYHA